MKDGEMWLADVLNKKERVIVRVDESIGNYVELVDSPGCVNLEHVKFLRKIEESDLTCGDSESKNGNMPAMPIVDDQITTYETEIHHGLTKREMIAMHLMASLIQGGAISEIGNEHWYAERACNLSDALLKGLDK